MESAAAAGTQVLTDEVMSGEVMTEEVSIGEVTTGGILTLRGTLPCARAGNGY